MACLGAAELGAQTLDSTSGFANSPAQAVCYADGSPEPAPDSIVSEAQTSSRTVIESYCSALNLQDQHCDRLQRLSFQKSTTGTVVWANDKPPGLIRDSVYSVASVPVGAGDYSCMSFHFDPPLPQQLQVALSFRVGTGSDGVTSGVRLWFEPGPEHVPELNDENNMPVSACGDRRTACEGVRDTVRSTYDADRRFGELKWCYFGVNPNPGPADVVELDVMQLLLSRDELRERSRLDRYCSALDMSVLQCARMSAVVFSRQRTDQQDYFMWDPLDSEAAPEGGDTAVASPPARRTDTHCQSLLFDPPWPSSSSLSFWWDFGHSSGTSSGMQVWLNPPADHSPQFPASGPHSRVHSTAGFAGWEEHVWDDFADPIGEVKWCYFAGNFGLSQMSFGRIDRLRIGIAGATESTVRTVIEEYCEGLNMAPANCAAVERIRFSGTVSGDMAWDYNHAAGAVTGDRRSLASPAVSQNEYSCMSFHLEPPIEQGGRAFFYWSPGRQGVGESNVLRVYYGPGEGHVPEYDLAASSPETDFYQSGSDGFAPWAPAAFFENTGSPRSIAEIKWCFWGRNAESGEQDIGRIDRFRFDAGIETTVDSTDTAAIGEYCDALDMLSPNCAAVERIRFTFTGGIESVLWDPLHAQTALPGDSVSVASQADGLFGDYSCMSLHFAPPIPLGERLFFHWSAGHQGGGGTNLLRAYINPSDGHRPRFAAIDTGSGQVLENMRSEDGYGPWTPNIFGADDSLSGPVSEIKWCFLWANIDPGEQNRGRVDRFSFAGDTETLADSELLANYCSALELSNPLCQRLSQIVFSGTGRNGFFWDYRRQVPCPGDPVVSSPPVEQGAYSCMSLHFEPPLPQFVRARFTWAVGRGEGIARESTAQFWFEPGPLHMPQLDPSVVLLQNLGSDRRNVELRDSFAERQSGELKWCYFGANPSPGAQDVFELDELELTYTREEISERSILDGYCSALDLLGSQCQRLSAIVFADLDPDNGGILWDSTHSTSAPEGGDFAVASQFSSRERPGCMSLHFEPPLPASTRLSFWWDFAGVDSAQGDTGMQVWLNPGADHNPLVPDAGDAHSRVQNTPGFAGWEEHRWDDFTAPIGEVKWCYFSARSQSDAEDFGRIDRLRFELPAGETTDRRVVDEYCTALNMSVSNCDRLERIRFEGIGSGAYYWDDFNPVGLGSMPDDARSLASPRVAAGDYSCMSLYFDPPLLQLERARFVWAIGRKDNTVEAGTGQFWFEPGPMHVPVFDMLGNVLRIIFSGARLVATRDFFAKSQSSELKWCYFGANPSPGPEDILELDRLDLANTREEISEPSTVAGYCSALDLPAWQCQRLSTLVFDDQDPDRDGILWSSAHASAAPEGGTFAVASSFSSFERPSCLSLRFDPPWPTSTRLSFWWDFSSSDAGLQNTGMQVWLNPGPGNNSLVLDTENSHSRVGIASGFAGWEEHRWDDFGGAIDTVKWCYFSGQTDRASQDFGRIDRLRFELPADETTERLTIGDYCAALNMAERYCDRLRRVSFSGIGSGAYFWNSGNPRGLGSTPDDARSMASPRVAAGDHSCMSLYFDPPLPQFVSARFVWAIGRGEGLSEAAKAQFWFSPGREHVPAFDPQGNVLQNLGSNTRTTAFSNFVAEVQSDELKWCYFGANPSPGPEDILELDRLELINTREEISERSVLDGYCSALDLPVWQCQRLSALVFDDRYPDSDSVLWNSAHLSAAPEGGAFAVASGFSSFERPSCLSMQFAPPWPARTQLSFWWDFVGVESGLGDTGMQVWLNPAPNHNPLVADAGDAHSRVQNSSGFAGWEEHRWDDFDAPIDAVKWCYFSGQADVSSQDFGRIDRLRFDLPVGETTERLVIGDYCAALNMAERYCDRLGRVSFSGIGSGAYFWNSGNPRGLGSMPDDARSVASPRVAAGDYGCMSLHFDPPLPQFVSARFVWAIGRGEGLGETAKAQFWFSPGLELPVFDPQGNALQNLGSTTRTTAFANFVAEDQADELKWCYFGVNPSPGPEDILELDRLELINTREEISERSVLDGYCSALELPAWQCQRLSALVFDERYPDRDGILWNSAHSSAAPEGGAFAVASGFSSFERPSCLSMQFAPPWPVRTQLSFWWDFVGVESGLGDTGMQVWLNPAPAHNPLALDAGDAHSRVQNSSGFAGWEAHRWDDFDAPIDAVKWCYFSGQADVSSQDFGRIDRLLFELPAGETTERIAIGDYCTALNMTERYCDRLRRIRFEYSGGGAYVWNASNPRGLGDGPADARSVASPVVAADDYSCMSFHFDPPLTQQSRARFVWTVGGRQSLSEDSGGQFWFPPGPRHAPAFDPQGNSLQSLGSTTRTTARSDFFAETQSDELKWCYFGANPSPGPEDILELDRLELTDTREEISERSLLAGYCSALDLPAWQCLRLSSIVFTDRYPYNGGILWSSAHSSTAPEGGAFAVASQFSSFELPGCMSLHFDPPWPVDTKLSFWWDFISSETGAMDTGMQVWLNPGPDHDPTVLDPADPRSREYNALGFAGWEEHRWNDFGAPIDELKWCYFSGQTDVSSEDFGRIDRLRFELPAGETTERIAIEEYCTALNMAERYCERLQRVRFESTGGGAYVWDATNPRGLGDGPADALSVASPAVAAEDYSCMSFHFDPPFLPRVRVRFVWVVGRAEGTAEQSGARFWFPPGPGHAPAFDPAGNSLLSLLSTTRTSARSEFGAEDLAAELKWCYFGANPNPGPSDILELDRLEFSNTVADITERPAIEDYCTALNLRRISCDALQRIRFQGSGVGDRAWNTDNPRGLGSEPPDSRSVASPPVGSDYYSCMSFHFDPPFLALRAEFQWAVGRGDGVDDFGRGRLWIDPDPMQVPAYDDMNVDGTIFNEGRDRVTAARNLYVHNTQERLEERVAEVRWCYFGANPSPGPMDILELDRLDLASTGAEIREPAMIARYCLALDLPEPQCARLSAITFHDRGPSTDSPRWDPTHPNAAPEGGDFSVASQPSRLGNPSCLELHFDPPWLAGTRLSFWWDFYNSSTMPLPAGMEVVLNHDATFPLIPLLLNSSGTRNLHARTYNNAVGFAGWEEHLYDDFRAPIETVRWCYFGKQQDVESPDEFGRIDRLLFGLPEICALLQRDSAPSICGGLSFSLDNLQPSALRPWTIDSTNGILVSAPPATTENCSVITARNRNSGSGDALLRFRWRSTGMAANPRMPLGDILSLTVVSSQSLTVVGMGDSLATLTGGGENAEFVTFSRVIASPGDSVTLRFCYESRTGTTEPDGRGELDWLSIVHVTDISSLLDVEFRLDVETLARLSLFSRECMAGGSNLCGPVSVGGAGQSLPDSLLPSSTLPAVPEDRVDLLWFVFNHYLQSGDLDVTGDDKFDQRDQRLFLRYLAGLRGDALSAEPADETRLNTLLP